MSTCPRTYVLDNPDRAVHFSDVDPVTFAVGEEAWPTSVELDVKGFRELARSVAFVQNRIEHYSDENWLSGRADLNGRLRSSRAVLTSILSRFLKAFKETAFRICLLMSFCRLYQRARRIRTLMKYPSTKSHHHKKDDRTHLMTCAGSGKGSKGAANEVPPC